MDAQRFDNLAKALAGRLSRRGALRRAGAAASVGLLASVGAPAASAKVLAQDQGDDPVYTIIRRYTLDGQARQVRRALMQGYVEDTCNAPGFIAYFAVEDEDDDFATVAVFRSQEDFENFSNAEANWIAQNLGTLLPASDETISGDTYVHVGAPEMFTNTCPGSPPVPTVAPPPAPTATAVPSAPTPTPQPACTTQGCVCTTGTRRACDRGLVCCPTTDTLGGPGICQPREVCNPNDCPENGEACPATCNTGDSCPGCCSGYCNVDDVCADPPEPPCTGERCDCTTGTQNPCDTGLICCGTTGTPGGPGTCQTEAECNPPCTSEGCACNGGVQGNCDEGLVCCQEGESIPGGPGTCLTEAECNPPCTGQGCDCNGGVLGACDTGLVCCQDGVAIPGGAGTCQPEDQCAPPPCTGEGCACNGGVQGNCDAGLVCCQGGEPIPGGAGTCVAEAECAPPPCTSEGCDCNGGVQGTCDAGLICCQTDPSVPGGPGTCQPEAACGPPPCIDNGAGCAATCNWGDACAGCCSGYCNDTGICDNEPAPPVVCTSAGCACATGTEAPCDEGLTCCATSDLLGGPGVCQEAC
jgi:heme-degrading monooxygenase HmoA